MLTALLYVDTNQLNMRLFKIKTAVRNVSKTHNNYPDIEGLAATHKIV